nr:LytTR family DNA-binding domain-containing protein [uncultured Clostridium sp.]
MNIAINYNSNEEYTFFVSQLYKYQNIYRKNDFFIEMYSTAYDLIYDIECQKHFDIIALSITKTDSSLDICKRIKMLSKSSLLILVSEDTLLAPKALELGVYRYVILKNENDFFQAFFKANLEVKRNYSKFYIISSKHKWIKIPSDDILYCYKSGKMSIIVTETEEYRERIPLYQLLNKLNKISEDFIAIERGLIISIAKLKRITVGQAHLEGDITLPIGTTFISDINKKFFSQVNYN